MNVKAFNRLIPFGTLMEHYGFERISQSGNKLRSCCKIHNGDSPTAFEVNTDDNVWYCHSGCKFGGDAIKLVQIMDELDFFSAIIKLSTLFNIDITTLTLEKGVLSQYEDAIKFFEGLATIPKTSIFVPPSTSTIRVKQYKGISEETCSDFNIRYTKVYPVINEIGELKGTNVYNRVIFDIKMNGNLIGQSLRSLDNKDNIRWIHMPSGFKRSRILFNYDKAIESINNTKDSTIIVCEGIMDVLRVYDAGYHNVVGALGCNITLEQIRLLSSIATDIILMLDNDIAGKIAIEKYNKMLSKRFDVYNVSIPEGKKDPGECSIDEIKYMILNRRRVL